MDRTYRSVPLHHLAGEKVGLRNFSKSTGKEGTGTRTDYLSDRLDKKNEGPFRIKRQGNREIVVA